jgi:hypothetical protein
MKKLLLVITILIGSMVYMSCSKDDSDTGGEVSSIVDTWRCDWGSSSRDWTAYVFNGNGTGALYDKGNPAVNFTYTYDSQSKLLTIEYSRYDIDKMIVSKITSDILVLDDVGAEYTSS